MNKPVAVSPLPIVFSHPGVTPHVEHAARALYEAQLLKAYVTTFAYRPQRLSGKVLRQILRPVSSDPEKELRRRQITELPDACIRSYPFSEMLRIVASRTRIGRIAEDIIWDYGHRWFDQMVAQKYLSDVKVVYGHEFAALKTFQTMKRQGGFCIFDQFIAHHRVIAREVDTEYAQFPQTETPYDRHLRRMAEVRNARKDAELTLADLIITASTFTCNSLIEAGFPAEHIRVVPMGGPPVLTDIPVKPRRPFIFLSAGSQSVRKGTHYLLEAWRKLRPDHHTELWLIGRMTLPEELLQNLPGTVVIRPTVPRQELYAIYQQASVLVFPSLCEGFGMVITEAMAHGLPVISTTHTAAPDLMTSGNEGLIVPVRDVDALAEAMQWCIDHPAELTEMGRRAHARVSQQQWSDYRIRLREVVTEFLHTCE